MGSRDSIPRVHIKDQVIKLPKISKQPTTEEQKDPKYCRYHRYVRHPTVDCRTLRWEVNRKIQDGTLQLSEEQQKLHKTPFPNYKKDKNKAVVSVVIQGNVSDMEVEESAAASSSLVPTASHCSISWGLDLKLEMLPLKHLSQ